ncbi:MAG: hypothetical protein IPK32_11775 [Verrucomicrobiaceae bacterium]|nr:hypothetical protein [Verrucomicrobiaceae bacterium]
MKITTRAWALGSLLLTTAVLPAQVPQLLNYQGRVAVGTVNFEGTGQFKFALVNGDGSTVYWGNAADLAPADGVPDASVSLPVTKGLYSVLLGDTSPPLNMTAIPASVWANADVRLRVWFNDGVNGTQLLTPDQRIAAVGYAMMADNVKDGAITAVKIAAGAVGTTQLAANAVEAGNIATGAVGSTQIATGAVGTAQLGDGSITAAKMLKPMRSGSISSSSIALTPMGGDFTVTFNPPFTTPPRVTLTLETTAGSTASTARVFLTSKSAADFSATVSSGITPTTLDVGTGVVGNYISHAIVSGNPAISYYDVSNGDLKYMRALDANGTIWGAPVTVDSIGDVGRHTSLAVVSGAPAISYYDATNRDLKFIRANDATGTTWSSQFSIRVIDSTNNEGQFTSLAVVNGNPAISYHDVTNGDLNYVRATNTSGKTWGAPLTLDSTGLVGLDTSLAVVNGNPAISYHDFTNSDLKYVRATDASGTTWGTSLTLDSTGSVGRHSSLTVVNGNPAISYYDFTNSDLKYLRATDADGTIWAASLTLDSTGIVGHDTSLAVVNGNPAISYYDATNTNLKYVRATDVSGTAWSTPVTSNGDSADRVGQFSALLVVGGNPAICYFDSTNGNLKFVRSSNVNGTSWGTPLALDTGMNGNVGQFTSQAIVNGHPAVSYYDVTNGDLKYVRATDPVGTNWGVALTIDSTGDVGQSSSLAVINGNPAICYHDTTNGDLKYVRANDPNGTTWGLPVVIDDNSQFPSLMMITGFVPGVSYYRNSTLNYIRALDINGATWDARVVVDATGNVGEYSSQKMVDGFPAISYYDRTNGNLKFVRSMSNQGLGWGTLRTIDNSTDNVGLFTSLEFINGIPAISYNNDTTDDLKFIRANDSTGSSWSTSITVDSAGRVGQFTSLAVINGNPAISYFHDNGIPISFGDNGQIKYVQALNPSGTTWTTPLFLDSTLGMGQYTSMVSVNGTAGISYYDSSKGELKYLRLPDASGLDLTMAPFTIHWIALEP